MQNLKKAFAIRHGVYSGGESGSLTEMGIKQSESIATRILDSLNGSRERSKIQIFTSPAVRARETASIIASSFTDQEPVVINELWGDTYREGQCATEILLKMVSDETEGVVVVTHFEAPSGVADFFVKKFDKMIGCKEIPKGSGLSCCLQTGDVCRL